MTSSFSPSDSVRPAPFDRTFPVAQVCLIVAVAAMLSSSPAAGQRDAEPNTPPQAVVDLLACRALADPDTRLACFDTHAQTVEAQVVSREIVVTDREAIREARRGLFGFSLPKLRIFGDDDDEDRPQEITATIDSAWIAGNRMRIRLADGAVWQQIGTDSPRRFPKQGMEAVIRRASMGTFFVRMDGQAGIRMMRVE